MSSIPTPPPPPGQSWRIPREWSTAHQGAGYSGCPYSYADGGCDCVSLAVISRSLTLTLTLTLTLCECTPLREVVSWTLDSGQRVVRGGGEEVGMEEEVGPGHLGSGLPGQETLGACRLLRGTGPVDRSWGSESGGAPLPGAPVCGRRLTCLSA